MRFLRMFTNSLLAGWLGAAYLAVLLLQLNPDVPLLSATTWRWLLTLAVTYGLVMAAIFYVVLVLRDVFSLDALSPGWASVPVLAWLSAGAAAGAATLMWLNASGFRLVLGDLAVRRMMAGALMTTASAVLLAAVAIVYRRDAGRGSRDGAALFTLAAIGSLALPLAARGPAVARPDPVASLRESPPFPSQASAPRVSMLLLDGASLEYIRAQSGDGRLPHFSRLLDSGASMYLATIRPTQPAPVWSTAATGMYPAKHGVRSAAAYYARGDTRAVHLLPDHCFSHMLVRLGAVRAALHTSDAWRARPVWDVVARYGLSAAIVRWPLTHPVRPLHGFVVSDRFHESGSAESPGVVYPPELLSASRPAEHLGVEPGAADEESEDTEGWTAAASRDRRYARALQVLSEGRPAHLTALRIEALDTAGHRHVTEEAVRARRDPQDDAESSGARQLDRAYAEVDAAVGQAVDALAPGDLLLVVSGFGMQRPHPLKRMLARVLGGAPSRGTHERAPDGFLIAYGASVHPGRLPRGSIVDVVPTVLYFLGVPIGRDMDGFARTDLFTSDFTAVRPVAFIATHN